MTRMFREVGVTWNPVVGCHHLCTYCYARGLAESRLRHLARYQDGFTPKLIEHELKRRFKDGLVFTSDMGDLWGTWVPHEWIEKVLVAIRRSPGATFLMLTKNPARYLEFLKDMPQNVILGVTIESNDEYPRITSAPSPLNRVTSMSTIEGIDKFVSIEPIMSFYLNSLVSMVRGIRPKFVYVGYDNHHHKLPEPSLVKTLGLIAALGEFTEVRTKTLRKAWWE